MAHGDDRTIQEVLSAEQAIRQRIAAEEARLTERLATVRRAVEADCAAQEVELEAGRERFLVAARSEAETAAAAVIRQAQAQAAALEALDDTTLRAALRRQLLRTLLGGGP